jgi:hypothetical protein
MFRLQTALSQVDALAARLFSEASPQPCYAYVSQNEAPVTASCVPSRRRRVRRQLAAGPGETLRSTWF